MKKGISFPTLKQILKVLIHVKLDTNMQSLLFLLEMERKLILQLHLKRLKNLRVITNLPAPFPKALLPQRKIGQNFEILDLFKHVKINIPLLDAIKQVLAYAKFLKDMCTYKRKHNVKKTAFLVAHVSSVLQNKMPPKYIRTQGVLLFHV